MWPLLFLLTTSADAGEIPEPSVSAILSGSEIEVKSSIVLPVKPCTAYAMLTDYDDLPQFIPGLVESRSHRISSHLYDVLQVGEVPVFIFNMKMTSLLEMKETPDRKITFRQIRGDFASYEGEWDFSKEKAGTLVRYSANMRFKPYVPLLLARSILDEDVKEKFAAIGRESVDRKHLFECS